MDKKPPLEKIFGWFSIAILLFIFGRYFVNNPTLFYVQAQFIVFILLVTIATRSTSVKYSFQVYASSLFISVGLTLFVGFVYRALGFDPENRFFAYAIFFSYT